VSRIPHWCDTTGLPDGLLNDLLPGPVTVLLPRLSSNHCLDRPYLNPGVQLVGVRVPDDGFIQSLVSALSETEPNGTTHGDCVSPGHPLVLTSANLSGNVSALTIGSRGFSILFPYSAWSLFYVRALLHAFYFGFSALESTVKTLEQSYGMRWLKSSPNSPSS
ncbi:hypothetical protein AHF37_10446, partial [Paragonimus kellicotti]